ncbi:MAG: adenosylcobinamide-phosphate synthase CbiB [Dysgonomonas sp.]
MGEIILHIIDSVPIEIVIPLIFAWLLDLILGDPAWMSHPVIWFGKIISWGEKRLNKGNNKITKGAFFSLFLIIVVFILTTLVHNWLYNINSYFSIIFDTLIIFYCLAATTLIEEVKQVFKAVDRSLEEGRVQVARIVGRDTSQLNPQQIRTAALETLAENLSDGVIAPLFWYMILGVPGMLAYKMINTLDSMIGYKSERYKQFGCWAARIDDIANYIPARLTAILMILVSGNLSLFGFVKKYGNQHASPNSGYPESALAGILNCRFGGPNIYFGQQVDKSYIGNNDRELTTGDMFKAISINKSTETWMIVIVVLFSCLIYNILR